MSKYVNRSHVINLAASLKRKSKKVTVSAEAISAGILTAGA